MDMRVFTSASSEDISRYAPPENFELRGKSYSVIFEGGRRMTLAFPKERGPSCVKIKDSIWLVATTSLEPPAACVLDLDAGLVTRVIPSSDGGFELSFGALEGISGPHHELADDLTGNTVEWTFGVLESSVIRAALGNGKATLTRPFAHKAKKLTAKGYHTVKITKQVYLQVATVTSGDTAYQICLLCDFHRILCVGSLFGPGDDIRVIGGHGKLPSDAYTSFSGGLDLRELSPFGKDSIHQYTPPQCYELSGKTFELAMDDGYDFSLHFLDNQRLEWRRANKNPAKARYKCLKADDTTYLVSYELPDIRPRVNHTFVLDLENMLVTRIISTIGKNPRWPYLMKTEFEFGAIGVADESQTYPRHGFTSDLIGNIMQWAYGSEMSTVHIYYCGDFYRLTHPRVRVSSKADAEANYAFNDMQNALPSTDEPTSYIKIKEGMYLISLTEVNCEKLLGAKVGFRSNTLCFLQNYKRCRVVGRAFGTTTKPDGTDSDTNIIIGAYGRAVEAADEDLKHMLTDPNPFLV